MCYIYTCIHIYKYTDTLKTTCATWLACVWHLKTLEPCVLNIYMYTNIQTRYKPCGWHGWHICGISYSYVYKERMSHGAVVSHVWHLSLICVTRLYHDSFIYPHMCPHMCGIPRSHLLRICVTWLYHDSFKYAPWLDNVCGVTYSSTYVSTYVWHLSLTCVAHVCDMTVQWLIQICTPWLDNVCGVAYSCRWYRLLSRARAKRASCVWCDWFISVVSCSCRW